jgi:magnesium chelatase family protein
MNIRLPDCDCLTPSMDRLEARGARRMTRTRGKPRAEAGGNTSRSVLTVPFAVLAGIEGRQLWANVLVDERSTQQQTYHDAIISQALCSSGFVCTRDFSLLEPHGLRPETTSFHLAVALLLLGDAGQIPYRSTQDVLALGRLDASGRIHPVLGTYAISRTLRQQGTRVVLVPRAAAVEASWVDGLVVLVADSLAEAVDVLRRRPHPAPARHVPPSIPAVPPDAILDPWPIPSSVATALDVAAAGGYNVLLIGPHGSSATWLAMHFVDLLPPPDRDEVFEIMAARHAAACADDAPGMSFKRPICVPPPWSTTADLIGGGNPPWAGLLAGAHHGVLVLDQVPQFDPATLSAMSRAVTDGWIMHRWRDEYLLLPAAPQVIATMTECPCGWSGNPDHTCVCSSARIAAHHARVPSDVREMFAIVLHVRAPKSGQARRDRRALADRRGRIAKAWEQRKERRARIPRTRVTGATAIYAHALAAERGFGATALEQIDQIAGTLADLSGRTNVSRADVRQAVAYIWPGSIRGKA